ncbi:response regulator transcription factor [Leptolyngbya sp. FACHB-261]|uniref:response regulator transcription factor n=1 Tax=Leptolyngbya sp. FACHB-261 TaxID=2692806 RepID=UPI00168912A5|nr:response regulator transcription factor [Leptolyngbya sp. FACHB-261]MBD2102700.1 response regulator transcription factor [Leptolyngbya sp. FACHB-261]
MKQILVVDDDPPFVAALAALLQARGYRVQTARNGLEALDILTAPQAQIPDVVVADVAMPWCDGLELCRRVRYHPEFEFLPFIFLSARTQPQDRVAGLRIGADDYLIKPFDPEELIVRVENLLERVRRMHSEIVRAVSRQPSEPEASTASAEPLLTTLPKDSPIASLTATEREVFQWVARGLTNREVADQMHLSVRTVQGHVANIRAKLHLPRREAIVQFAYQHRLM